jgi:hypothetical protein
MAKKNINIIKIRRPAIRNDGKAVRIEILGANNQDIMLTIPTDNLSGLIEDLIHVHNSAKVRQVLPETYRSLTEFNTMPTPFPVSDVNVAAFAETGGVSIEAKNVHGHVVHLYFLP